jgi:hypothetical protein
MPIVQHRIEGESRRKAGNVLSPLAPILDPNGVGVPVPKTSRSAPADKAQIDGLAGRRNSAAAGCCIGGVFSHER